MTCSTTLLDAENIWVAPGPAPPWWLNSLCLDVSHDTGADGHINPTASLRWFIYATAKEGAQHGCSLTFFPPPVTANPPFIVQVSDTVPFCIEEAEQLLHTCFRMQHGFPPAILLCPFMLKLLRLKLAISPYDDPPELQRMWPCQSPAAINLYEIVSRSGPRALSESNYHLVKKCIGPPSAPASLCTDALSSETNILGWSDADPMCRVFNQAQSAPLPLVATNSRIALAVREDVQDPWPWDVPDDCEDTNLHGLDEACATGVIFR
jgi:hypothetical protein